MDSGIDPRARDGLATNVLISQLRKANANVRPPNLNPPFHPAHFRLFVPA